MCNTTYHICTHHELCNSTSRSVVILTPIQNGARAYRKLCVSSIIRLFSTAREWSNNLPVLKKTHANRWHRVIWNHTHTKHTRRVIHVRSVGVPLQRAPTAGFSACCVFARECSLYTCIQYVWTFIHTSSAQLSRTHTHTYIHIETCILWWPYTYPFCGIGMCDYVDLFRPTRPLCAPFLCVVDWNTETAGYTNNSRRMELMNRKQQICWSLVVNKCTTSMMGLNWDTRLHSVLALLLKCCYDWSGIGPIKSVSRWSHTLPAVFWIHLSLTVFGNVDWRNVVGLQRAVLTSFRRDYQSVSPRQLQLFQRDRRRWLRRVALCFARVPLQIMQIICSLCMCICVRTTHISVCVCMYIWSGCRVSRAVRTFRLCSRVDVVRRHRSVDLRLLCRRSARVTYSVSCSFWTKYAQT